MWAELERAQVVVVCAAGNRREDLDAPEGALYPACLDRPNILCVGAFDRTGKVWSEPNAGKGSGTGKDSVDVFAPGSQIAVSDGSGAPRIESGTSLACAFAAGVVARLINLYPNDTAAEILGRVRQGAERHPNFDEQCKWGMIRCPPPRLP